MGMCAGDYLQEEYDSAVNELHQLRASRIAYASEFATDAEGLPDVGNIHSNIRAMKAENAELLETLKIVSQSLAWLANGECRGFHHCFASTSEALNVSRKIIDKVQNK